MTQQFVTRVPDDLAAAVDELIASGEFGSRSEAVREGLAVIVDRLNRARIGAEVVEGYRRVPQTDEELAGVDEATRRMIEEEPW